MLYHWATPSMAQCRLFKRLLILCCKVIWCVLMRFFAPKPPHSGWWKLKWTPGILSCGSFPWLMKFLYIHMLLSTQLSTQKRSLELAVRAAFFSLVFCPINSSWISLLELPHLISWTQAVCWIGLYLASPSQHCSLKGAFHRDHCFVLAVVQYLKMISLYILSRFLVF